MAKKQKNKFYKWFIPTKDKIRGELIINYSILISILLFFMTMIIADLVGKKSAGNEILIWIYLIAIISFILLFISLTVKMTIRFKKRYSKKYKEELWKK